MAKIVHYYDAENDIVYIDTIWDMRMNPPQTSDIIYDIVPSTNITR